MHARWLESCLQLRNENSSENARRFLLKYGQFRHGYLTRSMKAHEWHPLVPSHVKKDLIALITPGEYWEMLLESDFWDEWKLLELFAEISSQLFVGANPIRFSAQVSEAKVLLDKLRENHFKTDWASFGHGRKKINVRDKFAHEDRARASLLEQRFGTTLGKGIVREKRKHAILLFDIAFNRAVAVPRGHLEIDAQGRPCLIERVHSMLGYAYLCLLTSFSDVWKRCERPDCGNLFLQLGRRKKFCDWYCGHIESVRRSRMRTDEGRTPGASGNPRRTQKKRGEDR